MTMNKFFWVRRRHLRVERGFCKLKILRKILPRKISNEETSSEGSRSKDSESCLRILNGANEEEGQNWCLTIILLLKEDLERESDEIPREETGDYTEAWQLFSCNVGQEGLNLLYVGRSSKRPQDEFKMSKTSLNFNCDFLWSIFQTG